MGWWHQQQSEATGPSLIVYVGDTKTLVSVVGLLLG